MNICDMHVKKIIFFLLVYMQLFEVQCLIYIYIYIIVYDTSFDERRSH